MPERVGKSDMVKVFQNEFFKTSDGTKITGPLVVRVHEFENLDILQIQAEAGVLYEVKGKTIEDFLKSVKVR